jgi:hypothetical protein
MFPTDSLTEIMTKQWWKLETFNLFNIQIHKKIMTELSIIRLVKYGESQFFTGKPYAEYGRVDNV